MKIDTISLPGIGFLCVNVPYFRQTTRTITLYDHKTANFEKNIQKTHTMYITIFARILTTPEIGNDNITYILHTTY